MDASYVKLEGEDKRRLKALVARSDRKGLWQLASHLLAILANSLLILSLWGTLWLILLLPLQGLLLIFLFAPLHECIHRTAFRSRWLNDAVATVCGAVIALPPNYFRAFHFAHHRYTQNPDKDPELLGFAKPQSLWGYLWIVGALPVWWSHLGSLLRHALGKVDEPFIPPRERPAIVREARLYLGFYGLVAALSLVLQSWLAVMLWLIPVALGQPMLRAYLLAEHTGCPLVPDMLENSRTTFSTKFVRWLAWNMPYHTAHHAYPAVPFHALGTATDLLRPRLVCVEPGYLPFHRKLVAGLRSRPADRKR